MEDPDDNPQHQGHRHARLQSVVRDELGALLRDDARDPRLQGLSVRSVELSVDYRSARVLVLVPADEDPRQASLALERAAPFIRGRLNDALDLKFVPALRFVTLRAPEEG